MELEKEMLYIRGRLDYLVSETAAIKADLAVLKYRTSKSATFWGIIGGAIPASVFIAITLLKAL